MNEGFVQAGDVRLQYFENGSGSPVVLVHGYQMSGRVWRLVQERLDPARYRSIAISNRGAGDSDRTPDVDDYSVESFTRDLLAAVTSLGLERFVLVGHSMGGATATQFALDNPAMVEKLVLLDPAALHGYELPGDWDEEFAENFINGRMQRTGDSSLSAPGLPEDFRTALQADVDRNSLERLLGGRKSMSELRLRERLTELSIPVLVIGGDQDRTVRIDNILAEFLSLQPEVRSLHVFHGVGHSPNVEVPDELVSVLQSFIEG